MTENDRNGKALALLEAYEAREEFRDVDAKLRQWQGEAKSKAKALSDDLDLENPEWAKVHRQLLAFDVQKLASLVEQHGEASRNLKEAKRKLEGFRLELDCSE